MSAMDSLGSLLESLEVHVCGGSLRSFSSSDEMGSLPGIGSLGQWGVDSLGTVGLGTMDAKGSDGSLQPQLHSMSIEQPAPRRPITPMPTRDVQHRNSGRSCTWCANVVPNGPCPGCGESDTCATPEAWTRGTTSTVPWGAPQRNTPQRSTPQRSTPHSSLRRDCHQTTTPAVTYENPNPPLSRPKRKDNSAARQQAAQMRAQLRAQMQPYGSASPFSSLSSGSLLSPPGSMAWGTIPPPVSCSATTAPMKTETQRPSASTPPNSSPEPHPVPAGQPAAPSVSPQTLAPLPGTVKRTPVSNRTPTPPNATQLKGAMPAPLRRTGNMCMPMPPLACSMPSVPLTSAAVTLSTRGRSNMSTPSTPNPTPVPTPAPTSTSAGAVPCTSSAAPRPSLAQAPKPVPGTLPAKVKVEPTRLKQVKQEESLSTLPEKPKMKKPRRNNGCLSAPDREAVFRLGVSLVKYGNRKVSEVATRLCIQPQEPRSLVRYRAATRIGKTDYKAKFEALQLQEDEVPALAKHFFPEGFPLTHPYKKFEDPDLSASTCPPPARRIGEQWCGSNGVYRCMGHARCGCPGGKGAFAIVEKVANRRKRSRNPESAI